MQAAAGWCCGDTNGGTLPHEIEHIVTAVTRHIPGAQLGIHCHNDTENAVANSLAAVRAGARQVQGTLNGVGERCGNANLISIIPNLMLKMGFATGIGKEKLVHLTEASRLLDDRLNRTPIHTRPMSAALPSRIRRVACFGDGEGLHQLMNISPRQRSAMSARFWSQTSGPFQHYRATRPDGH